MGMRVMTIAEQIEAIRDPNVPLDELSRRGGGTPTPAIWARYSRHTTHHKNAMEPPSVIGYARGLGITVRSAWLSMGASLGLDVGDEESELMAHRPPGLQRLKRRHVLWLRDAMMMCIEDADREDELTKLRDENDRLRRELDALRTPPKRKPAATT